MKLLRYALWALVILNTAAAADALVRSIWKLIKFNDFRIHVNDYLLSASLLISVVVILLLKEKSKFILFILPPVVLFLCRR